MRAYMMYRAPDVYHSPRRRDGVIEHNSLGPTGRILQLAAASLHGGVGLAQVTLRELACILQRCPATSERSN